MKFFTSRGHELPIPATDLDAIVRQTYDEIIADPDNTVTSYGEACAFICDESAGKITQKLNNLFAHMGTTGLGP